MTTTEQKLTLAREALRRIALNIYGDTVPQVVAGDALAKIDAIATESAPAAGVASNTGACVYCGQIDGHDGDYPHPRSFFVNLPNELSTKSTHSGDVSKSQMEIDTLAQRSAGELPPLPEADWVLQGSANNRDGYTADQMNARYREGFAAGSALVEGIIYERDAARAQLRQEQERGDKANSTIERYWSQIVSLQAQLAARAVGGVDELEEFRKWMSQNGQSAIYIGDGLFEGIANDMYSAWRGRAELSSAPVAPVGDGDERAKALEEAAQICEYHHVLRSNTGHPREASTARILAEKIRAALTQQKGN